MPLYEFQAATPDGKKRKGYVNADTLLDAKNKLRKTDLIVWKIREYTTGKYAPWKKAEVLSFTRELLKLLRAGLPIFESLLAIEEKYQGQKTHTILLDLIESVKQGDSLSKALALHEKSFELLYIKMIENGEKSGNVEGVLEELIVLMEKQTALYKNIIQAVSYPALLFSFCLVILFGLLFFIIPSLAPLFEGRELTGFTKAVLSVSDFFVSHQTFLAFTLLVFSFSIFLLLRLSSFRARAGDLLLRIPKTKDLLIKHAFIRFCRSTATLLESGIPLVETMELAGNVVKQTTLKKELEKAKKGLLEGSSLSKEFEKSPYIPHFVVRMLSIAEKSGKASEMFKHIALIYEEEFSESLRKITSYMQPILMLFIGIIVGTVLLSVLLPLTDVSSFID